MKSIDLNADLGEGAAFDAQLLAIVSSASIACGGHAGSNELMRATLTQAKAQGVRTGAHPGFVDPEFFGRRELDLPFNEIAEQVVIQIQRISEISAEVDQPISYVKLHGALYNLAARDLDMAAHLFGAVKREFGTLAVLALDGSAQVVAATRLGMKVIREGFADRTYASDGKLVPRSSDDAVLHDATAVLSQAIRMVCDREILAHDGTVIPSKAQSICLHGDNVAALELAKAVRSGLETAGVSINS